MKEGEWGLIKRVTTARVAVSSAAKQAREREFVGRHGSRSLMFRKCAIPYYPYHGCVREGGEVGRILANFYNSESSEMASSLHELAFWSAGIL